MKLSEDLKSALRQAAEQEASAPPHEFSTAHEQQMQALFSAKPTPKIRWLRVVIPLVACLAVVMLVGWHAGWWMPQVNTMPPTEGEPGATTTTTTTFADAGDNDTLTGDQNTDGASVGNSSYEVCIHMQIVTVTSVEDNCFIAVPNGQIPNEYAGVAVTELVVPITDAADYAVGDQLTVLWKSGDCRLEGTRCYVTPYDIQKEA